MLPSHSINESRAIEPERFDGSNYPCRHFLVKLKLYFSQVPPSRYPTDYSKSTFLIALLQGPAFDWGSAFLERDDPILTDFGEFVKAFTAIFDTPNRVQMAMDQLYALRQGADSAATFVAKFQNLACLTTLDQAALILIFRHGINETLLTQLAYVDIPPTLQDLMALVVKLDQRRPEHARISSVLPHKYLPAPPPNPIPSTLFSNPIPMEVDASQRNAPEFWSRMSEREKRYLTRVALRQCTYCGSPDHKVHDCPSKSKKEGKGKAQSHH